MKQDQLEQIFIGSILRNQNGLVTVQDIGRDLKTEAGLVCFAAASSLFKAKKPVDVMSLAMSVGVSKYAAWISEADDSGSSASLGFYAEEIRTRAAKERIKSAVKAISANADISSLAETLDAIRSIYSTELIKGDESGTIHEAMQEFEEQAAKYRDAGNIGIPTGFTKWDAEMITYEPGHLWALGGFTSVGKTATALEFIGRIGHCKGIAVFSMEMTKPQIISRMLSRITGYSSRLILSGTVNDTPLKRAKEYLSAQPLHIFRRTRDWSAISTTCRALKMQGEIDIAVFDYQQNIAAEGKSTHDKMETISRSCQDLVQDLEITGVMLSQISLQQNREDSGAPEFKGGGGLAECSDVAIHLSRPKTSKTDLIIEMRKNRHGPKIDMLLEYADHYTRLEEKG